jgi:outer membrane protein assembly factor BamB
MRYLRPIFLPLACLLLAPVASFSAERAASDEARRILSEANVSGGLIVHLGCGDGRLTAALRQNDGCLVQGLDATPQVALACMHVEQQGLYGHVSVHPVTSDQMPYIDNLVNLVVVEDLVNFSRDEILRVLAPEGVAMFRTDGGWEKVVKPRPDSIDRWTHYMHDPTNNAVAHDDEIQPPRHVQWLAGPKWSRQHDHMSSASAAVCSGKRNFYIFDEGPKSSIQLPSDWQLIARDAFNGKVLWRRPIDRWHTQMWRLKSGPAQLPRRLVATDDVVYATLSIDAPLSALDAATGETIRVYEGTRITEEILLDDGILYLVVADTLRGQPANPKDYDYRVAPTPRTVMAVDAETGKVVWRHEADWVAPVTLTVDDRRVLYFNGCKIVCLDREKGEPQWQSETVGYGHSVPSYFAPTLVSHDGVILFAGAESDSEEYHIDNGTRMTALDAETGETLWQSEHPMGGYRSPEDIFVIDGLVWCGELFESKGSGIITGRDLRTGEVKVEFPPDAKTHWFHHRCYRAKATDNYLLTSRTGIEFVDFREEHWECHHWVRGACLYGILPANGMIYNAPHPCACYLEAKMFGFNALTPATPTRAVPREVPEEERLTRYPACDDEIESAKPESDDSWPTYRRDNQRSGFTKASVSSDLAKAWQIQLKGRLTAPVIAEGLLLLASVDEHRVHALDAATGRRVWSSSAGGRVDSPPTIWQGRVLFGCADGAVYCFRASDGEDLWRFRVAPMDRQLVAFEQVESVWPVHGSVLVKDGTVWAVAGRSMFVDGGIRLVRLDAKTGRLLSEESFDDRDPESSENLQIRLKGLNMPVALPDILVADDEYVYMRSQRFDSEGRRRSIDTPTLNVRDQQGEGAHLFCPTGFLDDSYWHRSYWVYGQRWKSGAGGYYQAGRFAPTGRLLVFDDDTVYGFSRKPEYFKWTTPLERQLFASSKQPEIVRIGPKPGPGFSAGKPVDEKIAWNWSTDIPMHVRAMVLAGDTLFVAGPPDVIDEEKSLRGFDTDEVQRQLVLQAEAMEGKHGASLWAVSVDGGRKLAEFPLDHPPVFDGMAAADGRLYVVQADGQVLCFGEE